MVNLLLLWCFQQKLVNLKLYWILQVLVSKLHIIVFRTFTYKIFTKEKKTTIVDIKLCRDYNTTDIKIGNT